MSAGCADLEAALRAEDPELVAAFGRHAATCAACRGEWELWRGIEAAAPSLRKEWPSPGLEQRIRAGLREELRSARTKHFRPALWLPLAAAACLVLALAARLLLPPEGAARTKVAEVAEKSLLTEQALAEVEKAEAAYVAAIEALAKVAEGRLAEPVSPVFANYREKLLLLDSAIAECRAQADGNRFNAHLRLELLSIYQEKQRTLESLLREDPHVS
ncbi:MAG TPA: hypothetical protein VI589_05720 [Vicinamibacteria bacterium]